MRKMSGDDFDELVDFFDQMAQTRWLGAIHERLKTESGSWQEKTVLDIGCGTGRLLERGLKEAHELIGIDLSHEMVEKSRLLLERSGVNSKIMIGDAYNLPLKDQQVDVALSTCVMFLLKGLTEMIRVVKPSGTITMLNPSPKMAPDTAADYATIYRMSGFERESLLAWSNVSTKRHRYSNEQLDHLLTELGASDIYHTSVLDGLATITTAVKKTY
ncbi:S-adenosylmethionine-dependent methyltransferase [Halalkalibacter wakoensis JCM 9140]|uniref:S-adenosylmethionine-dependent methyltransferase n=1 Tax=Halalkalibacter wakoensis JCM 9140 TaxID=1236970 RepID=W4PWR7_9BACI|nr:class I SAM-dependent methyltransferase [Halalkalibacter wakoensis]GAE24187.1 S-adenosylmethionine-dependent methyltransferase [Halalkalibacter wakoensis JCM 9140]